MLKMDGIQMMSLVSKGGVYATQFHPEKSGHTGLKILESFLNLNDESSSYTGQALTERRQSNDGLAKRVIACLDVRSNDDGDLVVTKGDQYDVREEGNVRNLGQPVSLAERYFHEGADEITFLNITGIPQIKHLSTPLHRFPRFSVI